jgi:hypothetical protein
MKPNEQVVLVGPPGTLLFECPDRATVIVHNRTQKPITFIILVVHRALATATRAPWRRMIAEAKTPGGPRRILEAFLGAAHQHLLKGKDTE